jgi:hypothetical protein
MSGRWRRPLCGVEEREWNCNKCFIFLDGGLIMIVQIYNIMTRII